MKVAINTIPLKTSHKYRGIGYYTRQLIESLRKENDLEIVEFTHLSEVNKTQIVHYPWLDLFFHTLPITRNYPTIVTVHDVMPLVFPKFYPQGLRGKFNLWLQKIALGSCDYVITDSVVSKKDIIKHLKIEERKISVIPLAADAKFKVLKDDTKLIYIRNKYHLPKRFLLYVGDANWVKNLPFLIEGFRELLKTEKFDDIKLVLVGGVFLKNVENIDHPELKSLKEVNRLIKQYGLEEKIIRPGQIEDDDLVVFYNLASIYIQPSFYEGFGLPVLEAFGCGTPVVSSNRGSLPEIGGQAAVYFDPENLGQFISIAKDLIYNASLRNKLSKLGILQAAKFSWKNVSREIKMIYYKVLNQ